MTTKTIDFDKDGNPFFVRDVSLLDFVALKHTLVCDPREVPFDNLGVPAQETILTQLYPDFYMQEIASAFRDRFLSLSIERLSDALGYKIAVTLSNNTDMTEFLKL